MGIVRPTRVEGSAINVDHHSTIIKIAKNKLTLLLIVSIVVKKVILPVNVLPTRKDCIGKEAHVSDVGQ